MLPVLPRPRLGRFRAPALPAPLPALPPPSQWPRLPVVHFPAVPLPDVRGWLRRRREATAATARRIAQDARAAALAESTKRAALDETAYGLDVRLAHNTYALHYDGHTTYARGLVIRDKGKNIGAGWLAEILYDDRTPGDVQVAVYAEPIEYDVAMSMLNGQRVIQQSVQNSLVSAGMLPHAEVAADLAAASRLIEKVRDRQEVLFTTAIALTLRAPTITALDALETRVRNLIAMASFPLGSTKWQQRGAMLTSGTPYPYNSLGREFLTSTTALALSLPWLSKYIGTKDGPYIAYSLEDGSPIRWYPLGADARAQGWPAGHSIIPAPNGSGKSVLAATIIAGMITLDDMVDPATQEIIKAPQVLVVDSIKGDFRGLVDKLGGQILYMSTMPNLRINFMDLPPATYLSGTGEIVKQNPVSEQARIAVGFLMTMCRTTSDDDEAMLEFAVLAAYHAKGIDQQKETTWTMDRSKMPTLGDVVTELRKIDNAAGSTAGLVRKLQRYLVGTLSGLFAGPTNLAVEGSLISFDLEHMDARMRPLVVGLINNWIWQQAKRDRRHRFVYLEEVKTLLENPFTAILVAHLYSLGRAYNLAVCSATQLPEDYDTPEGKRALQNAHTVFLPRQAPGAVGARRLWGLSAEEAAYLEACPVGSGMIITPNGRTRARFDPPPYVLELMGGPAVAPTYDLEHPWDAPS